MAEWFKAHAWKACVCKKYRGFESLSLRHFAFSRLLFHFSRRRRRRFLAATWLAACFFDTDQTDGGKFHGVPWDGGLLFGSDA